MKVAKEYPNVERWRKMLLLLQDHEPVRTRELCEQLHISRSSLSEDKSVLSEHGFRFDTSKRGYLRLLPNEPADRTEPDAHRIVSSLKTDDLRCWFILLLLWQSETPLTFEQILNQYYELFGYSPEGSLHKQLHRLRETGWVEYVPHSNSSEHDTYRHMKAAPALLALSENNLDMFCYSFSQFGEGDPLCQTLKPFYIKVSMLLGGEYGRSGDDKTFHVHGRLLPPDSIKKQLDTFLQLPYAKKALKLTYETYQNGCETCLFSTGLLVFSVEKNRFYLLGEAAQKRIIIPVDAILQAEKAEEKNTIYNSVEYKRIFAEMFSVSVDDPCEVRVRFQDKFNIREKVESLCRARPTARLDTIAGKEEFIYTDTIRGLNDFARYLRGFGSSAIVEEPADLRERMMNSSRKVMENYERYFRFE